ncbi:pentatricopeptide repeat-containing protein At2g33680-like [Selaginella moellendorffii]|uniref:pentatricopeptide repeat-containing protein At2g33680-like n=1 Tax=Selaginella moellendorffii TaxID=88036 RepID=UPI000D1C3BB6|nr:pentatricopeptide repeat-containing protein At2g33680-like [Selaginella moellendorffii]|eukprot:XP_024515292.1 pentatricopeptide repeat-containing protein At2g33680-like [Selaginella moellendorffii]
MQGRLSLCGCLIQTSPSRIRCSSKGFHRSNESLATYHEIRERGQKPGIGITLAALKVCRGSNDLKAGRKIHADLVESGDISSVLVASTLVDMYAKCGSLVEARKVFESMENHDVVSWNSMIQGYVQGGDGRTALDLYSRMQEQGKCAPNRVTVLAALKACVSLAGDGKNSGNGGGGNSGWLKRGREIHSQAAKSGDDLDAFVGTSLIDMYAKCGSMDEARQVFESLHHRCVQSWNCLILRYAQKGDGQVAWELFSRMNSEGYEPDSITLLAALKACASLAEEEQGEFVSGKLVKAESLEKARSVHSQADKSGALRNAYVSNALIDFYAKFGSLEDAHKVFKTMPQRTVVSWNSIILGYAQSGEEKAALDLYSSMKDEGGVAANRVTLLAALKACAGLAGKEDGKQVDGKIIKVESLKRGRALHSQAVETMKKLDVFVESSLVDLYAKCGSLGDACRIFESMEARSMVSWNCIILGLAQSGFPNAALRYYCRMRNEGCLPNAVTFVAVLKACGVLAALELGKRVQDELMLAGFGEDPFVATSLIDFFGKCGSIVDAEKGDSERVFDLFEKMQEDKLRPNEVTFLSVLTACSHAGLVEEGKGYFRRMSSEFGIAPRIRHYTCMVDLLGRANQLDEAVAMVKKMACEPDVVIYTALLSSCWKWKNTEVGRFAFEEVMKMDSKNTLAYALMANVYSAAGLAGKVGEIQEMGKTAGVLRRSGQSWWTDRKGRVHVFVVGDKRHPLTEKIQAKLDDLFNNLERGQGNGEQCGSGGHDNDLALCGHTEKFAVACALLSSPPGAPVRVVNNYKTCEECHATTALISKLEQRTVIVRDTRLHIFRNGICSCESRPNTDGTLLTAFYVGDPDDHHSSLIPIDTY